MSFKPGERHYMARLTNAQVREIRAVYAKWRASGSGKGYGALADVYGVSPWTVRDIVKKRTRCDA